MFEQYYAKKRAAQAAPHMSVAEIAGRDRLSYTEAVEQTKLRGEILSRDPRAHLDPVRVRKFSQMSNNELIARYGAIIEKGQQSNLGRDDRVRYAAAAQAGREHFDLVRSGATGSLAKSTERQAIMLARSGPVNTSTKELLTISAALSDKAQRERAMEGFQTKNGKGNIAKAAKQQGRSWIDVRDDLVKFGVLDAKDPRRKIRKADIEFQKGGKLKAKNTLSAADLEDHAMLRLKKNPKDEQALGWLATSGAMQGDKEAKKVKGTLPPKKKIFKRGIGLEL